MGELIVGELLLTGTDGRGKFVVLWPAVLAMDACQYHVDNGTLGGGEFSALVCTEAKLPMRQWTVPHHCARLTARATGRKLSN